MWSMKLLWRKCLGLTASVLVAGAAAADPPGPEANASRVIARSDPAAALAPVQPAAPERRPIAVTLDRPRVAADEGVTPASFRVEPAGPVFRAQAPELGPVPGGPITSTIDPPAMPL